MNNQLNKTSFISFFIISILLGVLSGCITPQYALRNENKSVPEQYPHYTTDTLTIAQLSWRTYFADSNLVALIDTALKNNQELNIVLQEIEISKNEIRAREGEYLPFVNIGVGAGVDKGASYTRQGSLDKLLDENGKSLPELLGDFTVGANASWEVDIWSKLRNAKDASVKRYLASIEGKNFMVTRLIAEIADAYYELMALDNLLGIIEQNIEIQSNALKVVTQQKEFARVTQLAVNRFNAQLLNTRNRQFEIKQKIVETENRINTLTGRFPKPIERSSDTFLTMQLDSIQAGIPAQLLQNRPDIQRAEYILAAAKLDVEVAKANFYPSLRLRAGIGFQAFNPMFLINPASLLYNLLGDIIAPLINRNALEAAYNTATLQQIQAVYAYEQTVLNAYADVLNQFAKLDNFSKSYDTKNKEVEILMQSIMIANNLFNSAKADYSEVLLTQKEALEAKTDAVEIKVKQLQGKVSIYRALGGGWR